VIRAWLIAFVVTTTGRVAIASHCHEVSPIIGRHHCGAFGAGWANDPVMGIVGFELATTLDHVEMGTPTDTGMVSSPSMMSTYHAQLAPGSSHSMWTLGGRLWFGYRGTHLTLGLEAGISEALAAPTSSTQVDGFAAIESRSADLFDFASRVGVHTRVGSLELGVLVLVGPRFVDMAQTLPPGYTTCDGGATGKNCDYLLSETQLVIAPRLRVDYWLTPTLTAGAAVGIDVINGSQSFALSLAVHGNAFDGS
jgi:hypothetical protein